MAQLQLYAVSHHLNVQISMIPTQPSDLQSEHNSEINASTSFSCSRMYHIMYRLQSGPLTNIKSSFIGNVLALRVPSLWTKGRVGKPRLLRFSRSLELFLVLQFLLCLVLPLPNDPFLNVCLDTRHTRLALPHAGRYFYIKRIL